MDKHMDKEIKDVVEQIIALMDVCKIVLFSKKVDLSGKTSSFKICVITEEDNVNEFERRIYINVESDIPFDALIYSKEDWDKYLGRKGSFCDQINDRGSVIYG